MDKDPKTPDRGKEDPLQQPFYAENNFGDSTAVRGGSEIKLCSLPGFKHTIKFGFVGSFCGQGHELSLVRGKEGYTLPLF